jgi:hypothetical protein
LQTQCWAQDFGLEEEEESFSRQDAQLAPRGVQQILFRDLDSDTRQPAFTTRSVSESQRPLTHSATAAAKWSPISDKLEIIAQTTHPGHRDHNDRTELSAVEHTHTRAEATHIAAHQRARKVQKGVAGGRLSPRTPLSTQTAPSAMSAGVDWQQTQTQTPPLLVGKGHTRAVERPSEDLLASREEAAVVKVNRVPAFGLPGEGPRAVSRDLKEQYAAVAAPHVRVCMCVCVHMCVCVCL